MLQFELKRHFCNFILFFLDVDKIQQEIEDNLIVKFEKSRLYYWMQTVLSVSTVTQHAHRDLSSLMVVKRLMSAFGSAALWFSKKNSFQIFTAKSPSKTMDMFGAYHSHHFHFFFSSRPEGL